MKAYKEDVIHYYKYITNNYDSGNAGGMYHYWDEYRAGATCAWIQMPQPMIVTSVVFQIGSWTNEFHEGYVCNIHLQASQDNVNWVNVKAFGDRSGCNTWHTLDMSDNTTAYNYYRFYAENGGWAYNDALSVASVEYRGYYKTINEVQEGEPYDYEIIGGKAYIVKGEDIRKYYKYDWEETTTPIFNTKEDAVNGVDDVKIIGGADYYYLTQRSTHTIAKGNTITFDVGETSKGITSIGFTGIVVAGSYPSLVMTSVQCSEDNSTWTTVASTYGGRSSSYTNPLVISTPNSYRFIRFTSNNDDGAFSQGGCQSLTIGYNKRVIVDGTPDDYDFYKDVNIYKALKSYEKGQYYGGNN